MRLLDNPAAFLILTAAAIVASDAHDKEEDAAVVGEPSIGGSMCSGGVVGSAGSVAVRGTDGGLATHTLIDVSAACGGGGRTDEEDMMGLG